MSHSVFGFFGLTENPFSINPNPRFLYLSPLAQAASRRIVEGIRERKGLILLTGEVGTGKTLLIRRLLDWLNEQKIPTALIFNSHVDPDHLLDFILSDFGVNCGSKVKSDKLLALNRWLLDRYRSGQTPVLIIDEAQGLPLQALEEVRLLLNLETPRQKLLQVILSGQPELEEKLKSYELRQLRQRITVRCRTAPLTMPETQAYIEERSRKAGAKVSIFQPEAATYVHGYSRGVPRVINLLCEHSLINACAEGSRVVSPPFVEKAARECQLDQVDSISRMLHSTCPIATQGSEIDSILSALSTSSSDVMAVDNPVRKFSNLGASSVARAEQIDACRPFSDASSFYNGGLSREDRLPMSDFSNLSASTSWLAAAEESETVSTRAATEYLSREPVGMAAESAPLPTRASATPGQRMSPATVSLFEAWWRSFTADARASYRQIQRSLRARTRDLRSHTEKWKTAFSTLRMRLRKGASDAAEKQWLARFLNGAREARRAASIRIQDWLRVLSGEHSSARATPPQKNPARKSSLKHSPDIARLRRWLREPLTSQRARRSKEMSSLQRRRQAQP